MSLIEIAEITGKMHKKVIRDIKEMEGAWEKVHGLKFQLMQNKVPTNNGGYQTVPMYSLNQ